MKQKIGFWVESQEDPANTAHAASENPIIPPRKSLVQVCFPQRGTNLSLHFSGRMKYGHTIQRGESKPCQRRLYS